MREVVWTGIPNILHPLTVEYIFESRWPGQ